MGEILDRPGVLRRIRGSSFYRNCAFRYSSDDQSPRMYYRAPHTRASENGSNPITTIASEPSDSDASHWFKVEEQNGVHWTERGVEHFKISI